MPQSGGWPDEGGGVAFEVSILSLTVLLQVDLQTRNDFIEYHCGYLNKHSIDLIHKEGSGVTIAEQPTSKLVLYFVHLLKHQNAFEAIKGITPRLFDPVPVHGIKHYHMDVNNKIIY